MLRRALQAPRFATIVGMKGEVGIGTMKSRIVRAPLQYLRKVQGDGRLMKQTIEDMRI